MESIRKIFRTGTGPSSTHTMGPRRAAKIFKERTEEQAAGYSVCLYGSLASTGRGHLTDKVIHRVFESRPLEIEWEPEKELPLHPNGMTFKALDGENNVIESWNVYSTGGGDLKEEGEISESSDIYEVKTMDNILEICRDSGTGFWEFVENRENNSLRDYLKKVWGVMEDAVERGLETEGVLPGGLGLSRKASSFYRKTLMRDDHFKRTGLLSAYALAVSEENATGGEIVTAPTCGSCGIVPAVLKYAGEHLDVDEKQIFKGLETAGLIGNLVKENASISGAQVGCQGEVGTACSMAAGALTQILGGTVRQIEYAAEMGLEHHLGLTCDPVKGLVQIPCIERNAIASAKAFTCADYALFTDGSHRISFDEVVSVMKQTGNDLPSLYKETSTGGLAAEYQNRREDRE